MQRRERILVVDNCRDTAESLAVLLELWGYEVYVAHDGKEGLATAVANHPDAVILDVSLPEMNGFDLARAIREREAGDAVLLVACTGYGQESYRRRSREAGIDRYLLKPTDPEVLRRLLARGRSDQPEKEPVDLALASFA